eukprot:1190441-Prorocentrum_minimum.AAC.4
MDEGQLMLQEENECFTEEYLRALTGAEEPNSSEYWDVGENSLKPRFWGNLNKPGFACHFRTPLLTASPALCETFPLTPCVSLVAFLAKGVGDVTYLGGSGGREQNMSGPVDEGTS